MAKGSKKTVVARKIDDRSAYHGRFVIDYVCSLPIDWLFD